MRRSSMPSGAGLCCGSRICAVKRYCSACVRPACGAPASGDADMFLGTDNLVASLNLADVIELAHQFGKRRDEEVALEQRRYHAEPRIGVIEQVPDRVDHGGAVAVDDQV